MATRSEVFGRSPDIGQVKINGQANDCRKAERAPDAPTPYFDRIIRRAGVMSEKMRACSPAGAGEGGGSDPVAVVTQRVERPQRCLPSIVRRCRWRSLALVLHAVSIPEFTQDQARARASSFRPLS